MDQTALILIDIQNDYFENGALELKGAPQAASQAALLLMEFREKRLPVVHVQHETLQIESGSLIAGTTGQRIHSSVTPLLNELCLTKHFPNAFWKTDLERHLISIGVNHLVIAGMMTHMCVSTTSRAAMERGFDITVIQDACATHALELNGDEISSTTVHNTALAELTMFAQISHLAGYIANQRI